VSRSVFRISEKGAKPRSQPTLRQAWIPTFVGMTTPISIAPTPPRHPRESGDPGPRFAFCVSKKREWIWIPIFALNNISSFLILYVFLTLNMLLLKNKIMFRKIISVFLLLIILGGLVPVATAEENNQTFNRLAQRNQICEEDNNCDPGYICNRDLGECTPGCRAAFNHLGPEGTRCPPAIPHCVGTEENPLIGTCQAEPPKPPDLSDFTPPNALIPQTNVNNLENACAVESQNFLRDIGGFVAGNILWGISFLIADKLISFFETLIVFGIQVGGILQPLGQAMNFLRDIWMQSLIWGTIASIFNWFAGSLIDTGIELNMMLTEDNPLITFGGRIILQITNLGFVISIIFIGIATILRIKKDEFSADKLLFKLIIGVVLANLTIPIALAITSWGTRITEVMYQASAPCPINITRQFAAGRLQRQFMEILSAPSHTEQISYNINNELLNNVGEAERFALNFIMRFFTAPITMFNNAIRYLIFSFLSMIAAALLSSIAAITFLIFAIFLFIRFVILMLLITFSPLIWFGFIFKDFKIENKNIWSAWWSHFLKWTFFGPIIILFIAFVSQYMQYAVNAEQTTTLVTIGHLIAVIIIAAMGIFVAKKFSGVAGGMMMTAATGGLGYIAGGTQGLLKRGQMSAQMSFDRFKAKGEENSLGAKIAKMSSKGFGVMGSGANINKGPVSLLKNVGISPNIKLPTDQEIRKGIIEKQMTNPVRGGLEQAGFSIGKGKFKIQGWTKETPENVLSLKNDEYNALSPEEKKAATSAIHQLQSDKTLNPKQIVSLRRLEKVASSDLANLAIKEIDTKGSLGVREMIKLSNKSIAEIIQNGTEEQIKKSIDAILLLEDEVRSGSIKAPIEIAKIRELRQSFNAKITNHIVDSLDPSINAESILNFEASNLNSMASNANQADKQKVKDAILELQSRYAGLSAEQQKQLDYLDSKMSTLQMKGEW